MGSNSARVAWKRWLLGLGALGAYACGGVSDTGETALQTERLEVTPPSSLAVALPRGLTPASVAVAAKDALVLEDRARVVRPDGSFAQIASVGTLTTTLGVNAQAGTTVSRPAVRLRGSHNATLFNVNGDLTTGQTLTLENDAKVLGAVTEHATIDTQEFAKSVVIPAPGQTITLSPQTTRTIQPGTYATVQVFSGSTLTLPAGTYYITSLLLEPGSTVKLQNDAKPVQLFLRDRLQYRGKFVEPTGSSLVGNVLVGVFGTQDVVLEAPYVGTLIAPKAKVIARSVPNARHLGSLYGRRVELSPDAIVEHHAFPSQLIQRVDVSKSTLCRNESALVTVTATTWAGAPLPASHVTIDGVVGDHRYVQFKGALGTREITVTATDGGMAESRTLIFTLVECAQDFPSVVVNHALNEPYALDLFVQNHKRFEGAGTAYVWSFSDGTTITTPGPYIRHSYFGSIAATVPLVTLDVTVTVTRPGKPNAATPKVITVPNAYARIRQRGLVQPPVSAPVEVRRDGGAFLADLTVRNLEASALTLTERQTVLHYCDPSHEPERLAPETVSHVVSGSSDASIRVLYDAEAVPRDVCALGFYYSGTAAGMPATVSTHLEIPDRVDLFTAVTDAEALGILNEAADGGLTAQPDRTSDEELRQLFSSRVIPKVPALPEPAVVASGLSGPAVTGQECRDGDVALGFTCQVTDEWKVSPPLIRNAWKGDLFITAGCGIIGQLLRSVTPRQEYTHEAIMTSNYYELAHSTFHQGRIEEDVDELGETLNPEKLKHGWPGTIPDETVQTAFATRIMTDPEGQPRTFQTFHPDFAFCAGDRTVSPPIMLRPPPASEALIRPLLRAAADQAVTLASHYRFFAFTKANVTFPGLDNFTGNPASNFAAPDGEPPTVSTTFIWAALKKAGASLEGMLEAADTNPDGPQAMPPTGAGIIDGLYFYTEDERITSAKNYFKKFVEDIRTRQDEDYSEIAGAIPAFTSQADAIAAQLLNCFASDTCDRDGAYTCVGEVEETCEVNHDFEHPGTGVAVSPEDFRLWDAPVVQPDGSVVGAYGSEEPMLYRGGDYRRVFRWEQAADAGTFVGRVVVRQDSGDPSTWPAVANATVTGLADKTGASDASGIVTIPGVPGGDYEAKVESFVIDGVNHEAAADVTILPGVTVDPPVVLALEPEGAHPPPGLRAFERIIRVSGPMFVFDDDSPDEHDECDFSLLGECRLSPVGLRTNAANLGGVRAPGEGDDFCEPEAGDVFCTDDEVRTRVRALCELDPSGLGNESADVRLQGDLWEDDECRFDDHDGSQVVGPVTVLPGEIGTMASFRVNNIVDGPDYFDVGPMTLENIQGDEVVLPDAPPFSRRSIRIVGTMFILDDDWDPEIDESRTFAVNDQCYLDPFSGDSHFGFNLCVGDEVHVVLEGKCSLSKTDAREVNISTRLKLYEGTTCLSDDLDGQTPIESQPPMQFILKECAEADGCARPFSLNVSNTDEGDDLGKLVVNFFNEQAP